MSPNTKHLHISLPSGIAAVKQQREAEEEERDDTRSVDDVVSSEISIKGDNNIVQLFMHTYTFSIKRFRKDLRVFI